MVQQRAQSQKQRDWDSQRRYHSRQCAPCMQSKPRYGTKTADGEHDSDDDAPIRVVAQAKLWFHIKNEPRDENREAEANGGGERQHFLAPDYLPAKRLGEEQRHGSKAEFVSEGRRSHEQATDCRKRDATARHRFVFPDQGQNRQSKRRQGECGDEGPGFLD